MNKKRIFAWICVCAVLFWPVPKAEATTGMGLGPGNTSAAENETPPEGSASEENPDGEEADPKEEEAPIPQGPSQEQLDYQQQQQDQIYDLNQQISDLKDQQSALQQQIENAKDQKEQAEIEKQHIDSQLYSTSQQIQLTGQKIDLLQADIEKADEDAAALEKNIDEQYELFKSRIRSTYLSSDYSFLAYLLGAQSFADFSLRLETVSRISSRDQAVIDDLEEQIETLRNLQEDLAGDIQELENSNQELESLKDQLNAQSAKAEQYISDIDAMEQAFLADTAALQAQQKAIQEEIDQIYANLQSVGEYRGDGTWAWPVPGYSYISSAYGWRFQGTDFHTGMDISGSGRSIYGAAIVASGEGTVVKVQNNGGSGYGLFCIIDHGGGYTTLYAHTSSIIVSVGDEVEKGQTIGYVGNSGWVIPSPTASNPTGGSHLHIEFRVNGEHQNPANYLY